MYYNDDLNVSPEEIDSLEALYKVDGDYVFDVKMINGKSLRDIGFSDEGFEAHWLDDKPFSFLAQAALMQYIEQDIYLVASKNAIAINSYETDNKKVAAELKKAPGFNKYLKMFKELDKELQEFKIKKENNYSNNNIMTKQDLLTFWSNLCKDEDNRGTDRLMASKLLAEYFRMFDVDDDDNKNRVVKVHNPDKDIIEKENNVENNVEDKKDNKDDKNIINLK